MALEKELLTYDREHQNLLANQGKFVVIQGDDVLGTYDTYKDALTVGYEKFGLQPFLIKQIAAVERANYFTRNISTPCRI